VKERAYDQTDVGQASAALSLRIALNTLLRLFAPVLSFAAEEAWSWFNDGSVHHAEWPQASGIEGDPVVLTVVGQALIGIRRAKTEAKVSQKASVAVATIASPHTAALRLAEGDLKAVGRIEKIVFEDAETTSVVIELAPQED
jgi:valyl-tRNA synthetase